MAVEKMTDIHMHVIPGVDDGAEDAVRSLLMIMRAGDEGIGRIFATSHSSAYDIDPKGTKDRFAQLAAEAARMFPDTKLYLGCEIYCDPNTMEKTLKALETGRYPTMNGTNYVLMEFSQWIMPEDTLPCIQALVDAGWKPIIAHMERYRYLRGNMALVDSFRELGALIQINAYSLYDEMNEDIKAWARRMVLEGKASFLGTDAHRPNHRPPSAKLGLSWLYENVDQETADNIVWGNARELLLKKKNG